MKKILQCVAATLLMIVYGSIIVVLLDLAILYGIDELGYIWFIFGIGETVLFTFGALFFLYIFFLKWAMYSVAVSTISTCFLVSFSASLVRSCWRYPFPVGAKIILTIFNFAAIVFFIYSVVYTSEEKVKIALNGGSDGTSEAR